MLCGIPLSDGTGEGRIWHAHCGLTKRVRRNHTIPESLVKSEVGRMRHAIQLVSLVLENSILQVTERLGVSYAGMFVVLREMLHDPSLMEELIVKIESQHLEAGTAIAKTFGSFRKRLSNLPDQYLKERANDLLELQGSLLDALASSNALAAAAKPNWSDKIKTVNTVAVVETLTPRLVLDLKKSQVSGIVCENAGPASHAAILCRALGIPAVEGIKNIIDELPRDRFAMIDGTTGCIGISDQRKDLLPLFRNRSNPGISNEHTIDLSKITLMANLNFARNAITALAAGAQGIGLYRTEFEFMVANRLLTEQEQFVRYRNVVTAMMGLPVTIRLIDIAADKSPEFFNSFGNNSDPSCCGALFLLSRPELFKTQTRAIARAAAFGPVRVLYPMVADAEQFLCLKKAFCDAAASKALPALLHGAMIEQPSAVSDARRILESADFACLGTNDLTKHLLHVDRDTAIAHGAEIVGSSKLWDAMGQVASVALTLDKELTVCGEMASDVHLLTRFTELGIKIFSMDIRTIRHLRKRAADPVSKDLELSAA